MNAREKNLVKLGCMLAVLTVVVRGFPALNSWRNDRLVSIANVQARISRLDNLLEKRSFWQQKVDNLIVAQKHLTGRIFYGDTPEIISARVQGTIKKIAQKTGVTINTLSLPEFSRTDSWLLISHVIVLEGGADMVFDFFQKLQADSHKLLVVEVNLRASGNLLRGSVKVTGFSRMSNKVER